MVSGNVKIDFYGRHGRVGEGLFADTRPIPVLGAKPPMSWLRNAQFCCGAVKNWQPRSGEDQNWNMIIQRFWFRSHSRETV